MSLRADFFGDLQKDRPLFDVHHTFHINVPPLVEQELGQVVSRSAALLAAQQRPIILPATWPSVRPRIHRRRRRLAASSPSRRHVATHGRARRWRAPYGGAIHRAWSRPGGARRCVPGAQSGRRGQASPHLYLEDLATVREDGEPTRRRAFRSEFSDDEWRLVSELADAPTVSWLPSLRRSARRLHRGSARGDLPALGQAVRMDRSRTRVPGLARWRGLEAARRGWRGRRRRRTTPRC